MSDLPAFANLGQEILNSPDSRYFLAARTEDRKDILLISLSLDGSESYERAVTNLKDALILSRQAFSQKGEYAPAGAGIDGRPRTAFEKASAEVQVKIQEVGAERIVETPEWDAFLKLRDAS